EKPHASVLLEALDGLDSGRKVAPRELAFEDLASGLVKLTHIAQNAELFPRAVLDRVKALGVAEREDLADSPGEDRKLFFDFDSRLGRAFGQGGLHPAAVEISNFRSSHDSIMKLAGKSDRSLPIQTKRKTSPSVSLGEA